MKVLLIHAKTVTRNRVKVGLEKGGIEVVFCKDNNIANALAPDIECVVIVPGWGLNEDLALSLVLSFKRESSSLPVLLMSVRGSFRRECLFLDAGVDSLVNRPRLKYMHQAASDIRERIRSLLQRRLWASNPRLRSNYDFAPKGEFGSLGCG